MIYFPSHILECSIACFCLTLKPTKQPSVRCLRRASELARLGAVKQSAHELGSVYELVQPLIKTDYQAHFKRKDI